MERILQVARHFAQHPKFLFLIDGLGALLTFSLQFFALRTNHHLIGVPRTSLVIFLVLHSCISFTLRVVFRWLGYRSENFLQ